MPEPIRADTVRFDLDSRLLACRGAANAAELASDLDQIRRIASAAGLFRQSPSPMRSKRRWRAASAGR